MLGPLGYTGTAAIPSPGSVVLVVFVLVALGLALCAVCERRRGMGRFAFAAFLVSVILLLAAFSLIGVRWGH